jgi:hypothetical protein
VSAGDVMVVSPRRSTFCISSRDGFLAHPAPDPSVELENPHRDKLRPVADVEQFSMCDERFTFDDPLISSA